MNVFKQRLLSVARSLRESAEPSRFSMSSYGSCGTPQCALGHYAFRRDLQALFSLGRNPQQDDDPVVVDGRYVIVNGVSCTSDPIRDHFSIDNDEAMELFGTRGCDQARSPMEAALFIEAFAERKYPTAEPDWNAMAAKPTVPEGRIASPEYV